MTVLFKARLIACSNDVVCGMLSTHTAKKTVSVLPVCALQASARSKVAEFAISIIVARVAVARKVQGFSNISALERLVSIKPII